MPEERNDNLKEALQDIIVQFVELSDAQQAITTLVSSYACELSTGDAALINQVGALLRLQQSRWETLGSNLSELLE
jgi:hypothetical protein